MTREIIKPTTENYNLHIPKEYIDKELEVVILPLSSLHKSANPKANKEEFNPQEFYAITNLSKRDIDDYLSQSKSEWE